MTQHEVRRLLAAVLPVSSEFEGFVHDHFKSVSSLFTDQMDRVAKTNLFFMKASHEEIVIKLKESYPGQYAHQFAKIIYRRRVFDSLMPVGIALVIFACVAICYFRSDGYSIRKRCNQYRGVYEEGVGHSEEKDPKPGTYCNKPVRSLSMIDCTEVKLTSRNITFNEIYLSKSGKECGNEDDQFVCSYLAEWEYSGDLTVADPVDLDGRPFFRHGAGSCTSNNSIQHKLDSDWGKFQDFVNNLGKRFSRGTAHYTLSKKGYTERVHHFNSQTGELGSEKLYEHERVMR